MFSCSCVLGVVPVILMFLSRVRTGSNGWTTSGRWLHRLERARPRSLMMQPVNGGLLPAANHAPSASRHTLEPKLGGSIFYHSLPNPRAPIEKTDGCNHMCCKKVNRLGLYLHHMLATAGFVCVFCSLQCRHDFCWVCLDEWKQHNTSTGGYFE